MDALSNQAACGAQTICMHCGEVIVDTTTSQHVDVLIVGAGLFGIGGACHLRQHCPDKSFVLLEGRDSFGGTWDLFQQFPPGSNLPMRPMSQGSPGASFGLQKSRWTPPAQREAK